MSYFSFCPHEPRRLNEADLAASKNFVFFRRRFHGRMHLSVPSTVKPVPAAGFSNTEAEPLASLANFQPSSLWFKFADRYRNLPPFLLFWSSCVREFSDIFRHVLLIPGPTSSYSLDTFLNTIFSLSLPSFSNASSVFFSLPSFSFILLSATTFHHSRVADTCLLADLCGGKTSLSLFDPDNLENETTNQQLNHYYQKATH